MILHAYLTKAVIVSLGRTPWVVDRPSPFHPLTAIICGTAEIYDAMKPQVEFWTGNVRLVVTTFCRIVNFFPSVRIVDPERGCSFAESIARRASGSRNIVEMHRAFLFLLLAGCQPSRSYCFNFFALIVAERAYCRAVYPFLSLILKEAFRSRSSLTVAREPLSTAKCKGVT